MKNNLPLSNNSHQNQTGYEGTTYSYDLLLEYSEAICADFPESNYNCYSSNYRTNFTISFWITDASGTADQHLAYMSFGESFVDERASGHNIRFKFTGKERDSETGFDYFGARYYDSDLSVWLSVDPLADKYPSTSSYLYVENNPIMFYDPDGRIKNPFRSKQYLQAKAYRDKMGGELKRDGFRKWSVERVVVGKSERPKDLIVQGENLKGAEVVSTKSHDVAKGVQLLEAAGVDLNKIVNSSNSFFNTLGRDLRQMDIKVDGLSWTQDQSDKFEKRTYAVARTVTGILFPLFKIVNWAYTIGSIPNNRSDDKKLRNEK